MEWQNHKLCNASIVYGIAGNLQATILTALGSVLPDVLEMNGVIKHRTITHYPYIYVVPLLILIPCLHYSIFTEIAFWTLTGCTLHLMLDAMSKSGIPYKTPYGNERVAFNLYTTHHISEIYIALFITLIFIMIGMYKKFMNINHISNEISALILHIKSLIN